MNIGNILPNGTVRSAKAEAMEISFESQHRRQETAKKAKEKMQQIEDAIATISEKSKGKSSLSISHFHRPTSPGRATAESGTDIDESSSIASSTESLQELQNSIKEKFNTAKRIDFYNNLIKLDDDGNNNNLNNNSSNNSGTPKGSLAPKTIKKYKLLTIDENNTPNIFFRIFLKYVLHTIL